MQHRVRLGKYKRDPDSIAREGENVQAIWSPDTKLIAVLVSMGLAKWLLVLVGVFI